MSPANDRFSPDRAALRKHQMVAFGLKGGRNTQMSILSQKQLEMPHDLAPKTAFGYQLNLPQSAITMA